MAKMPWCASALAIIYLIATVFQASYLQGVFVEGSDGACEALSVCGGSLRPSVNHVDNNNLESAEEKINRYLASNKKGGEFYIQGWRWHTMALVREARGLHKLSQKLLTSATANEDLSLLKKATDYVVGFNMKGLHKIEKDLFFPWVRKKVDSLDQSEMTLAFGVLMNQLDDDREGIENLGRMVNEVASIASDPLATDEARLNAFQELSSKSAAIADRAKSMLQLEDRLLVPTIAMIVSATEQKSFNDKVIRNLGILDSRLHLVGMHEAVWALHDQEERQLFQKSIPSIPQRLIPRWKRLLYEPRVGVLNDL